MTTINTQDLTGTALEWAVAKAENLPTFIATDKANAFCVLAEPGRPMFIKGGTSLDWLHHGLWSPSTSPAQGQPIIEREQLSTVWTNLGEQAFAWVSHLPKYVVRGGLQTRIERYGPTALIAAMRCHVACKLGDTVDVPQELLP